MGKEHSGIIFFPTAVSPTGETGSISGSWEALENTQKRANQSKQCEDRR